MSLLVVTPVLRVLLADKASVKRKPSGTPGNELFGKGVTVTPAGVIAEALPAADDVNEKFENVRFPIVQENPLPVPFAFVSPPPERLPPVGQVAAFVGPAIIASTAIELELASSSCIAS